MSRRTIRFRSQNSIDDGKFHLHGSSVSVDNSAKEIIQKINFLEEEEKLFLTYDVIEPNPRFSTVGGTIYSFINQTLEPILHCELNQIKDQRLIDLIIFAFFKRKDVIPRWNECEHPMFAGLLVVYISNKMRKMFLNQHEPILAEAYEAMQNRFDDECTALLDQCFHTSEKDARSALDVNYHIFIHHDGSSAANLDIELMSLASEGKAKNFLAHPACQREIERRWQPGFKIGQFVFCLFFFFPPLFFLRGRKRMKRREVKSLRVRVKSPVSYLTNFWLRIFSFYTSPNAKYVIHTVSRILYVVFYAYVLMTMRRKTMILNELEEFWDEIIIITWHCAYLIEMAVMSYQRGFLAWSQSHTADFYRNLLILITVFSWCIAVIVPPQRPARAFAIVIADLFFYFSFVFATIRLMKVANVDAFFGSIVLMIKKMMPIMLKFLVVFLVFWFTYAVCHISLAGHLKSTPNITDVVFPWLLFSSGAFEIFGEADDEDKLGQVRKCSSAPLNWDNLTDSTIQCWFKSSMIPIFLFFYMLVSSVLLVNLVTALLSKKYEDIDKVSHVYWKYKLYSRLIEYEEKIWIPAPLSLIFYVLKTFCFFPSKIPYLGVPFRHLLKCFRVFEGRSYSKERLKSRKPGNLDAQSFLETDKEAVVFVRKQMDILAATKQAHILETETIKKRFEAIMREFERSSNFRRIRSQTGHF
ncbi:unnamed protein product [Caenorhabditis auriculariae]|uniref:Ion transport domain-containing protein n=1 Tax=Caenorhabditis auriculariae TaxID=2777116 RepID=A0A8S1HGE6_9PELO|nr:unnamed protein product [Caenorhabditis auriculariae]